MAPPLPVRAQIPVKPLPVTQAMPVANVTDVDCGSLTLEDIDYFKADSVADLAGRYLRFCLALQTGDCGLDELPDNIDKDYLKLLSDNAECSNDILLLVQCCIALFLCIMVIIVNCVMIVTLIKNKHLHSTTNWLLLSLAFSDLLFGLSSIYTPVMTLLTTSAGIDWNDELMEKYISIRSIKVLCLLLDETGLGFATMTASLLSLVALAIEKYIAVFAPLRYDYYMKPATTVSIIVCVWIIAIIFGFLPLMGWNDFKGVCVFTERTSYSYLITWSAICMSGAVLVFILYTRIFLIARKHARRIQFQIQYIAKTSAAAVENGLENHPTDDIAMERLPPNRKRRFTLSIPNSPIRAVKTVGIILGVFYVCWLPMLIYFLAFPEMYSNLVIKFLITVALMNSLFNPFIYGVRNRAIREAIVCCLWSPKKECSQPPLGLHQPRQQHVLNDEHL